MKGKHGRTLEKVFEVPERGNIPWREIESLFVALGGEVWEGSGSRVRVALRGVRAVFHRPRPGKEANKATVKSVRRFLQEAGAQP
jgi:hypothetical protein